MFYWYFKLTIILKSKKSTNLIFNMKWKEYKLNLNNYSRPLLF